MSKIAPHRPHVTVKRSDVEELRSRGSRALLLWEGGNHRVKVRAPGFVPGPEAMIIGGHEELNYMLSVHAANNRECTSDDIAQCFTELAREAVPHWAVDKALIASAHKMRIAMMRSGLYLTAAPDIQTQAGVKHTDTFRWSKEPSLAVSLTTTSELETQRAATVWHDHSGEVADLMIATGSPQEELGDAAVTGAIRAVMARFLK